ncbi:MAG: LysR family transcriptional regulator [Rhodobacteraceae bacterium]|nr:LysR family transcriptional regulator [Paracoccaceae bacterium]
MAYKTNMKKNDVMRLDGHTLRVFLTVFETSSVCRTADVFELNQSTISHSLDKMRAATGDPLFVKSGRGITATERAKSIIPQVKDILANLEGLVEVEDYDAFQDTSRFCIGLPNSTLVPLMKSILVVMRTAAPDVQFQLARLPARERMAEMLTLNELDLAIAVNCSNPPSVLNSTSFGQDRLVVFFDPDFRDPVESVDDYVNARHVIARFGGKSKSIVEVALEELGLKRKISVVSPTISSVAEFVQGTDMVATMPAGLAENAFHALAHCAPPLSLPQLQYDLVWHRRFDRSGRNKWFRNMILQYASTERFDV